jgi:hypothetical protein
LNRITVDEPRPLAHRIFWSSVPCDRPAIANAEREPAFDDLVKWIENRALPMGDDLLGDVTELAACEARELFRGRALRPRCGTKAGSAAAGRSAGRAIS